MTEEQERALRDALVRARTALESVLAVSEIGLGTTPTGRATQKRVMLAVAEIDRVLR